MKKILTIAVLFLVFPPASWAQFSEREIVDDIMQRTSSIYEAFQLINEELEKEGKALCQASYNGNLNQVKYLLEGGVNVNFIKQKVAPPRSALNCAIKGGKTEVAKYLVLKGAWLNRVLEGDSTPLEMAIATDNGELVEFLLAHGANPDIRNDNHEVTLTNTSSQ